MKPAVLPIPPRDAIAASTASLEAQRVRDRAVDEVYFRFEIEPGQGALSGGATVIDSTTYAFTFEDFPAAAVVSRRRNVHRKDLWPKTTIRMNLWYTSDVGSTNTFAVGPRIRQVGTGMSLAAPSLLANPTVNIPGPAVANDVLFATVTTTVALLPSPEVVGVSFARVAPDANANLLRMILVEFVCQEAA